MEILTSSLEVVEDVGAEPVTVVIKEARLPIIYQPMEQKTPNPLTQVITVKIPVSIIIK